MSENIRDVIHDLEAGNRITINDRYSEVVDCVKTDHERLKRQVLLMSGKEIISNPRSESLYIPRLPPEEGFKQRTIEKIEVDGR